MATREDRYMGQDKFCVPSNIPTKPIITSIESIEFHNGGEHYWKRILGVDQYFKITFDKLAMEE